MPVPRGNPWLVSMRGTVHGVVLPGGISPGKGWVQNCLPLDGRE